MTSVAYVLILTIALTKGGAFQAECDTVATTYEECSSIAKEHEETLRKEFVLAVEEKGMCPFKDIKIHCYKENTR